jgi:nicotinamidase-related amidase
MKKKVALLIIDAQNDFCDPKGSLFVDGAVEDNERLSKFIVDNKEDINFIGCTLDSHQFMDIAHPNFWFDKDGNHPNPFSVITAADVENGTWSAVKPQTALKYLKDLEADGQFPHVIWPVHCVIGTWGNQLEKKVNDAVLSWASQGHFVQYVSKGANPFSEHFGAFEAQVPIQNVQATQYNLGLQKTLEQYDVIYLTGQAKSHCVANTLKQLVEKAPDVARKVVVLEDTMSPVGGGPNGPGTTPTFDEIAQPIYDAAAKIGVRFSTTVAEGVASNSAQPA